jgi:hypothetical protein
MTVLSRVNKHGSIRHLHTRKQFHSPRAERVNFRKTRITLIDAERSSTGARSFAKNAHDFGRRLRLRSRPPVCGRVNEC